MSKPKKGGKNRTRNTVESPQAAPSTQKKVSKNRKKVTQVSRKTKDTVDVTMSQESKLRSTKKVVSNSPHSKKKTIVGAPVEQSARTQHDNSMSSKSAKKKRSSRRIDCATPKSKSSRRDTKVQLAIKFAERAIGLGVEGLKAEFNSLNKSTPNPAEHCSFLENPQKNRYKDVPCCEATRVRLQGLPSDYVHANYVFMEDNLHQYICAQAPLQLTLADFWCIVLQEECQSIVMLCDVTEASGNKCYQYWNETEGQEVFITELNLHVTTMSVSFIDPENVLKQTMLRVTSTTKNFVVKHIHWCNWPDRGVPKIWEPAFTLLAQIKADVKPVLVHCSAGIGRTGCIVCIDIVFSRFLLGKSIADVPEVVRGLRRQRNNCVQVEAQYLYVHYVILHKLLKAKFLKPEFPGLTKFFDDYYKGVVVG